MSRSDGYARPNVSSPAMPGIVRGEPDEGQVSIPGRGQPLFSAPGEEEDSLRSTWQMLLVGWAVFRRRWPVAVLIAVLGTLGVGLRLATLPPKYEASGLVQVGMHADVFADRGEGYGGGMAKTVANTHLHLLSSDQVVETAMRTLGREIPDGAGRREAFTQWINSMRIEPIRDTFLVSVTTSGQNPREITERVNALMDAFIPFSNEFVGTRFVVKQRQLSDREEVIRENLRRATERLTEHFEQEGRRDFGDRRSRISTAQEDLQKQLTTLQIQHASAEAEMERLVQGLDQAENMPLETLAARVNDETLGERLKPLVDLRAKLLRLSTQLRDDHPELLTARAEVEAEETALRESLREAALVRLEAHKQRQQILASEEEKLAALLAAKDLELMELDKLEGVYSSIQREVEFYDKELESIRGQMARVEGKSQVEMAAQIVNRAEVPAAPVSRFTPKVVALTIFGMCFLGLATIVAWDHLEDTVSSEDAARMLGIPVLGRVPVVDLKKTSELELLRDASHHSRTAEAFRLLRTNTTFAAAGLKGSAVLVTSGTASDGKSITSAQLALSLARIGDGTVLLIEGDMRRPRQQQILDTAYDSGLSDVLAGLAKLEDVCHPTEFEHLHFLPSGPQPPNSADLLVKGRFDQLMEQALKVFDYVVVDSPPVVGIADTSMMAPHVKGVLFVLKLHHSRRRSAAHAIEQVEAVGGRPLGLVVNGVSRLDGGYGYGYGYYGGYYSNSKPETGSTPRVATTSSSSPTDSTEG